MSNALSMDLRVRFKRLMEGDESGGSRQSSSAQPCDSRPMGQEGSQNGEPLEPRPSGPRTGSGKLEPCMPFFA